AAVTVQRVVRGHQSRGRTAQERAFAAAAVVITQVARVSLRRRRRREAAAAAAAAARIQARWRGLSARRKFLAGYPTLWWRRAQLRLARLVQRCWRGCRYGRRLRRAAAAAAAAEQAEWSEREWAAAVAAAGAPRAKKAGWQQFLLAGSMDTMFYRHPAAGVHQWEAPTTWLARERLEQEDRARARRDGVTAAKTAAARRVQAAWRARLARERLRRFIQAKKLSASAEEEYLSQPRDPKRMVAYLLFLHCVRRDYDRVRPLYARALADMERRGPDM
ncbi:unnamed protein product, partial [Phaeothamnion confervicola]